MYSKLSWRIVIEGKSIHMGRNSDVTRNKRLMRNMVERMGRGRVLKLRAWSFMLLTVVLR